MTARTRKTERGVKCSEMRSSVVFKPGERMEWYNDAGMSIAFVTPDSSPSFCLSERNVNRYGTFSALSSSWFWMLFNSTSRFLVVVCAIGIEIAPAVG